MRIGNKEFDTKNNTYIMGILNVTPDSFSDGGKYNNLDNALYQAEKMIKAGADILDIGGESTRPGYTQITEEEEIARVMPILEKLKNNFDVPLSLDSYKSNVILAAKDYIDLVNDIWGLRYGNNMADVIADLNLPCCLMHNRKEPDYTDFWTDYISDIKEIFDIAHKAGIKDEQIILDGGVGFQKTYEQNLMVLNRTEQLCEFGCPVMIAASKKSVIGLSIDKPINERLSGTLAITAVGVLKGAAFVRVHDVDENMDVIKMTRSIMEERKWTR